MTVSYFYNKQRISNRHGFESKIVLKSGPVRIQQFRPMRIRIKAFIKYKIEEKNGIFLNDKVAFCLFLNFLSGIYFPSDQARESILFKKQKSPNLLHYARTLEFCWNF